MRNLSAFQPNGLKQIQLADTPLFSDANLVSYWKLEDLNDSKGSNNLTNNGSTVFAAGKFNNGIDLERGSSQYLSIADASQTGLDITGDFSICAWVKLESAPASGETYSIVAKDDYSNAANRQYYLKYENNTGTYSFTVMASDGTASFATKNYTMTAGTFYQVAVSVNLTTDIVEFFINGVSIGTAAFDTTVTAIQNTSSSFKIGGNQNGGSFTDFFDGVIDDVAIFSKALTAAEVSQLYYLGSTKAYYPLNGNSNDFSGNTNTGTDTAITYPQGRFGQGARFNGSTSQINLGNSGVNVGTGDFTVSCWYYLDSSFADGGYIIMRASGASPFVQYLIYPSVANSGFVFQMNNTAAGATNSINASGLAVNRWYHLMATISGTTMTLYVNGNPRTSQATFSGTRCNLSINSTLGLRDGGGATAANGIIDEVIIESRAWTAKEVETYYRKSVLNYHKGFWAKFLQAFRITETATLTETISNLRARNFSTAETATLTESVTSALGKIFEIFETVSLSETFTTARTFLFNIAETVGLTEVLAQVKKKWTEMTKNSTTFTEKTKNSSTWTEGTKS